MMVHPGIHSQGKRSSLARSVPHQPQLFTYLAVQSVAKLLDAACNLIEMHRLAAPVALEHVEGHDAVAAAGWLLSINRSMGVAARRRGMARTQCTAAILREMAAGWNLCTKIWDLTVGRRRRCRSGLRACLYVSLARSWRAYSFREIGGPALLLCRVNINFKPTTSASCPLSLAP